MSDDIPIGMMQDLVLFVSHSALEVDEIEFMHGSEEYSKEELSCEEE